MGANPLETGPERELRPSTLRAYLREWRRFADWARTHGQEVLPAKPEAIISYLESRSEEISGSTQWLVIAAIDHAHGLAGMESAANDPAFRSVWRAFRSAAEKEVQRKQPIDDDLIAAMIRALPTTLLGLRDAAVVLLGYRSGFRRSELADLLVSDVLITDDSLSVLGASSGRPIRITIDENRSLCAVTAVRRWLDCAAIVDGPLFRAVNRHGQISGNSIDPGSIARAVKRAIERCGLDPSNYACESLRRDPNHSGRKQAK